MAVPVLIDTDMGADDALAVSLALMADRCDLQAVVAVGGNVSVDQAACNIGRLLQAVDPAVWPQVGRGLDQDEPGLADARAIFGADGFGQADLPTPEQIELQGHRSVYRRVVSEHAGRLHVLAIGPLTNLADLLEAGPQLLSGVVRVTVMGGAIWVRGNVGGLAEFNFYRDPQAAGRVLSSELPITLVPLDLTRQVIFDESHLARLRASGTRAGEFLAAVLPYAMEHGTELPPGQLMIHDALAVGSLLWPELFLKTELGLEVELAGPGRGRCRPVVPSGQHRRVSVLTAVDGPGFLERMLEQLCRARFVV